MSRRTERIASVVRDVVARAIQSRLSDPRIEPLTSVTRVEVSPDLSIARVNVSVLANEAHQKLCVEALQAASGRMRAMLADALSARTIPRLVFHLDTSLQRGFETVRELDRIMQEMGPPAEPGSAESAGPEERGAVEPESDENGPESRPQEDA